MSGGQLDAFSVASPFYLDPALRRTPSKVGIACGFVCQLFTPRRSWGREKDERVVAADFGRKASQERVNA